MTVRITPNEKQLADLALLIEANHPLWAFETAEEDRVEQLLRALAERCGLPYLSWSPVTGLVRHGPDGGKPPATETPGKCLAFIEQANFEGVFHLTDFGDALTEPEASARVKEIYRKYFLHRGIVVISAAEIKFCKDLEPLFSSIDLVPPTPGEYHDYVSAVLRDLSERRSLSVDLDGEAVTELLRCLQGLSFFEVRKIITRAIADDGRLSREDLPLVFEAKRRIIQRSGALEFYPHSQTLGDVAGLEALKAWLRKRERAFVDPAGAEAFGITPPKGLLLLGVQGCGKSLCAKAVAAEWKLPLVRLDPSNLYNKFFGESERNFRRAIGIAEAMAPVVLWVDEIEKALGQGDSDGGTSQRVFGTFLSWLQEKRANVFVIATANDIARLPPELLRKGRFDEIFFVDLPDDAARADIFELHLRRRGRDPNEFDLGALSRAARGFSGAEIEQAIVSAMYTAFSENAELTEMGIVHEINATRPMSVTMAERIESLRAWARDRAVRAD